MHRKIVVMVVVLALAAVGCGGKPKGPLKYSVDVDAKSTPTAKVQYSAFFPGSVTVSPGDTIKFRNRSTEAPHTITFGVKADRSNEPALFGPKGTNAAAFGPCYSKDVATTKLAACSTTTLPPFDGTGYWNSGLLQPKPAPKSAGDKSIVVKIAKGAPAGDYTFLCLLHPFMNGTLKVVKEIGERAKPADIRKAGKSAASAAAREAAAIDTPTIADVAKPVISAGWGNKAISINRFGPASVSVKAGTLVSWTFPNPGEPHTVTFESKFTDPEQPGALDPAGPKSGSDYTGGFVNSGLADNDAPPFALRFTKAGTYPYVCVLHPGMRGTITVT